MRRAERRRGVAAGGGGKGYEEATIVQREVPSLRKWRLLAFEQAVGYLREYRDSQWTGTGLEGPVLKLLGLDQITTAAACIDRFSQGKASLFEVDQVVAGANRELVLSGLHIAGAFPLHQVTDDVSTSQTAGPRLRPKTMTVAELPEGKRSAAADAVLRNETVIQSLADTEFPSDTERELGTTHVLAIPLGAPFEQLQEDEPAVVTVDLAVPRPVLLLSERQLFRAITERAETLRAVATDFLRACSEEPSIG